MFASFILCRLSEDEILSRPPSSDFFPGYKLDKTSTIVVFINNMTSNSSLKPAREAAQRVSYVVPFIICNCSDEQNEKFCKSENISFHTDSENITTLPEFILYGGNKTLHYKSAQQDLYAFVAENMAPVYKNQTCESIQFENSKRLQVWVINGVITKDLLQFGTYLYRGPRNIYFEHISDYNLDCADRFKGIGADIAENESVVVGKQGANVKVFRGKRDFRAMSEWEWGFVLRRDQL